MCYQRLFFALFMMALPCGQSRAQTTLPYFTGFDSEAQKTGWQEFRKGVMGTYHWNFQNMAAYSAPGCVTHSYPVGGTDTTKNWFVSPPFALTSGGKLDSLRYAFTGFGVPGPGDTVAIYLLRGSADPALATSRTLLYDFRGANYVGDNAWRKLDPITIPAAPGSCYIAIYYRTAANWLDVRFDNFRISGSGTTNIDGVQPRSGDVLLYPNPANEVLYLKTERHFKQTCIYDLGGKLVYRDGFRSTVPIAHLPAGNYLIECTTVSGIQWKQSFVKR